MDHHPDIQEGRRTRRIHTRTLALAMAGLVVGAPTVVAASAATDQGGRERASAGDHRSALHVAHGHGLHEDLAGVRAATARFHRLEAALAAGYERGWVNGSGLRIITGCVASPSLGAMGFHYFHPGLMADHDVDPVRPEVLVYAPAPDGGLRLVAVEWVVLGPKSDPPGPAATPSVLGMDMHVLAPPPGPAFYLTHAWVWANNPAGMFADFNPEISCG